MKACKSCQQLQLEELIHFGDQPICHRFVRGQQPETRHSLAMGQCLNCGLVQLMDPVPVEDLTPIYDWVKYNEPEGHLPALAKTIANLPDISPQSRFLGVCVHDVPLCEHLRQHNLNRLERVDPVEELGLSRADAGVEAIQSRLNLRSAEELVERRGQFDVVVARRILEHAHDGCSFLAALRRLVRSGGYVVIEVPDCQEGFAKLDPGVVWEEHVLYFTPVTIQHSLLLAGFEIQHFEVVPYPLESAHLVIARASDRSAAPLDSDALQVECDSAARFVDGLCSKRKQLTQFLAEFGRESGAVALLGAGHRSCTYVNLMEIGPYLQCVIDDDPNKQNLKMPGSLRPVRPSSALLDENIKLCLLGINPNSEDRFIQRNQSFLERGGSFASIWPGSKYQLQT